MTIPRPAYGAVGRPAVARYVVPLVLASLLGGLAGCAAGPAVRTPPPSASVGTPLPTPGPPADDVALSGAGIRDAGIPVTVGDLTLWVLGDGVDQAAEPDGSVSLTVPVDPDPGLAPVHIAPAEGSVLVSLVDGSVLVQDATGTAVGGLSAPEVTASEPGARQDDPQADRTPTGGATAGAARFTTAPDQLGLLVTPGEDARQGGIVARLRVGSAAIVSAEWGEREGGRSLAVVPTDWLRAGSRAAQEVGWSQLVAAVPEVDTPTMRDQFDCHALGARDKDAWNLEPWRPDVGALEVLATRCNPT